MRTLLLVCLLAVGLSAQEAQAPTLSALEREYVERLVDLGRAEALAKSALEASKEYKTYHAINEQRTKLQADRLLKIEAAHPGYTVDWAKRALIVKPPQQAKQ